MIGEVCVCVTGDVGDRGGVCDWGCGCSVFSVCRHTSFATLTVLHTYVLCYTYRE